MNTFAITFRIADKKADGKTYDERYNALVDKVNSLSKRWWVEPSSFFLIETDLEADALCSKIKATIAEDADVALILSTTHKIASVCGKVEDDDLYKILDFVKKC